MDTIHTLRLRLLFYKDLEKPLDKVPQKFEDRALITSEDYKIKTCENHIWFYVVGAKKQYCPPHLQIELEALFLKILK